MTMIQQMTRQMTLGVLLGGVLIAPAFAGFDVTRMTTVVDDFSGSYTVTTTSRRDEGSADGLAQAEFTNFHPRGENATLSGSLINEFSRGEGSVESSASGDLTLDGVNPDSGEPRSLAVSFEDLQVSASADGAEITGEVTVNGEVHDAADLPEGVAAFLRRVFWLIRR